MIRSILQQQISNINNRYKNINDFSILTDFNITINKYMIPSISSSSTSTSFSNNNCNNSNNKDNECSVIRRWYSCTKSNTNLYNNNTFGLLTKIINKSVLPKQFQNQFYNQHQQYYQIQNQHHIHIQIQNQPQKRSLTTSTGTFSNTHYTCMPLEEFRDTIDSTTRSSVKVGRSWSVRELRLKSFDDLHKLWIVLYKERNMLLTEQQLCRRRKLIFPQPERIMKVRKSMGAIKQVLGERKQDHLATIALQQLQKEEQFVVGTSSVVSSSTALDDNDDDNDNIEDKDGKKL